MITERNDSDQPAITPQQYEVLHGGGAEAAEIAKQRLSRRRFMRRSMLAVWGISTTAAVAGALFYMYPNLAGQFGADLNLGDAKTFPAATPDKFALNQAGVFYHQEAKTYLVHMAAGIPTLLKGQAAEDQYAAEGFVTDTDGSRWVALYTKCVHLGCTYAFRNDCLSFKCPCHGSHYNITGEYLDGPAPRSCDRFVMSIQNGSVVVSTGTLVNPVVPRPDATTRIIAIPTIQCAAQ